MAEPFTVRIFESTTRAGNEASGDNLSTKPPVSSISINSTDSDTASASEGSFSNSGGTRRSSSTSYNHLASKTSTADRLCKAANKSTRKNRSEELAPLREKYDTFCKQFKPFVGALKSYHASIVELEKNRMEVLDQLELFTKDTPLAETTGKISPIVSANPQSWAKTVANRENTYCSQGQLTNALNTKYAQQIDEHCIAYIREWETVVTTRINTSLAKADDLKKTWKHYEKKVKQLQDTETKLNARGKECPEKSKEK